MRRKWLNKYFLGPRKEIQTLSHIYFFGSNSLKKQRMFRFSNLNQNCRAPLGARQMQTALSALLILMFKKGRGQKTLSSICTHTHNRRCIAHTYYIYILSNQKQCYQTANLKNKIQPEIIPPNFEMIFRIQVTNLNWNEGKSDFKKLPLSKKKLQELSIRKKNHTIKL